MPGTSSAIPEDLLRFERTAAGGATDCALATAQLQRSAARLADSRSYGLAGLDLAALGRRLRRQVEEATTLADRTGDIALAFTAAGGEGGGAVTVDDAFVAACLRLPDGRALTLDELVAMPYAARLGWFLRFLDSGLAPPDPNFRAVAGVLAAALAAGADGLWDDAAFRVADAGLLEAMQLGLVVAASGATWRPRPGDARSDAVEAWVSYFRTVDGERRDSAWAHAEERSVRYGETVADRRGLRFGDDVDPFVRFSHVYRAAIHEGEQQALAAEIIASLDPIELARLADDVREAVLARLDAAIRLPLEPVVDWIRRGLFLNPLDAISAGLDILHHLPGTLTIQPLTGVVEEAIELVIPTTLAAMLLDPSATPPGLVATVLDDVLGVPAPMAAAPGAYYVAMLADRGYLRGLPTEIDEIPGAVPLLPGE